MENNYNCTILILYRADSIRRLYNLLAVIRSLKTIENCIIYVREADSVNHNILPLVLPNNIKYEFIFDNDETLHKTWHFNDMLRCVSTSIVGIWDADVISYSKSVNECLSLLISKRVSLALPYNGICLDTSEIIANLYLKSFDFSILQKSQHFMKRLQPHILTGGAVLMNRLDFLSLDAENENYYGWGDDDFDRYIRFMNANMKIFRSNTPLFHLSHPRGINSNYLTSLYASNSKEILAKTINGK